VHFLEEFVIETPYVGLVYRNFRAYGPDVYSHIGLGVNAFHTVKVLRKHGIRAYPISSWTVEDAIRSIRTRPFTHVVLEALWIAKPDMVMLAREFPDIKFFIRSHSQVGFLQVEPSAIKILRDMLSLQESELNVQVAGNSPRFKNFITGVYNQDCVLMPNLYNLERPSAELHAHRGIHRKLRVASFGSLRHLKMHSVAAAGAMLLAQSHGLDLEFNISVHREEHGAGVLQSLRYMFSELPWAVLKENPWRDWGDFRRIVAHQDLCLQISATETFNLATADAVAESVPCVVSEAIDWTPAAWRVDTDDAEQIAATGWQLLNDPNAAHSGIVALTKYMHEAVGDWKRLLKVAP
jgi:hypothetical protein